jgi:phenylalanyl-tRNA synthetase beta chain
VNDFPYAIEDGILIIEEPCEVGQDIHEALGINDTCVEFEITSNRPDCLSVIGLAREIAATYDKPLSIKTPAVKGCGGDVNELLSVEVKNSELCTRYVAKVVQNVKIEPSPRWLRERLRASGVRPINNLVDITNYVMLEYGHPMHAFDLKYVDGAKIVVRNAEKGEKITTLDGAERELSEEMLVIADAKKPAAVAGIMGGEYSGIMEDTTTVVFEAACFKGTSVRTTAKKLGLRTESSARFEKGLDAQNCVPAIMRACELVELLGAGEVVDGMIDVDASDKTPFTLKLEHEWINRFLGINIPKEEMVKILEKVGFTVNGDDVTVPFFRIDIEHKADIAEEIARFYGYNNIPTTVLKGTAEAQLTAVQKFERKMSDIVLSMGGYEVITYSFISPKYYDKILLPKDSAQRESVVISNPLGEDTSVMRTTTLPSMLEILSRNYNNRNPKAFMYEIGNEYISQAEGELPQENPQLTIGLYGENTDFYALKGIVEVLIERLNLGEIDVAVCSENPTFHPGRCAVISKGGIHIGILGEVHPKVCNNYEIGTKTYIAKLDMNAMFSLQEEEKQYKPLPKFPATSRDLSVLCDKDLPIVQIEKAIKESVGKILEKVELFDVYQGAQVPEGQKSVAYSIIMRSHEGTLTDEQTDAAMKRVLKAFDKMGIKLRS